MNIVFSKDVIRWLDSLPQCNYIIGYVDKNYLEDNMICDCCDERGFVYPLCLLNHVL